MVRKRFAIIVPLLGLAAFAGLYSLPYYSIGPGPAREVAPLIEVTGHPRYPSQGRFVMTSITFRQVTALGAFIAWLDPDRAVVPEGDLFTPGDTKEEEQRRSISQMDQSKIDAVHVVLSLLADYPDERGKGALVEGVISGCSAAGRLYPGDVILEIDGDTIGDRADASAAIDAAASGETLTFEVRADGETEEVDLVKRPCGDEREVLVGVSLLDNFPFGVSISSGDIGGPSAGLMWALGLYDLLTPGDLTGGRTIAGTGQIDLDGTIYPIGGIGEKILAAGRAGADVILIPRGNLEEARAAGDFGIELVPVSTFQEALDYLESAA